MGTKTAFPTLMDLSILPMVKKESPNMGTKTTQKTVGYDNDPVVKKESPNMGTKGRLV